MPTRARLIATAVPEDPEGVVLVLHGGGSRRGNRMVSPTQLSVLRMIPIAGRIARAGRGRLAVFRLLNSVRGWDSTHTPVQDVRWALEELRNRWGTPRPTCLVGHSLGGRAALLAATAADVRSAVALAPWVYPSDSPGNLADRRILIVHGSRDRIAKPSLSLAVARQLAATGRVGYLSLEGGQHAMLKHHRRFDGYAAQFAVATLLGQPVDGPVGEILAGASWLQV